MQDIQNALSEFGQGLQNVINTAGWADLLDILVVAFLLYQAVRLVRETRAMQLVKGIGAILALYLVASYLNLITLTFLITNILQWGIVALAILFQPELRRALEQVGRSKIPGIGRLGDGVGQASLLQLHTMIDSVCGSAEKLSASGTGALMVIERETKLGDVIVTGTIIDSEPSIPLITNLFYPNTPLHDGAMILRDCRLHAAGCFLPLSANTEIGRELGTRHRAALGMSEVSDALVVVVSEETGAISVALDGKLQRELSPHNLSRLLSVKLLGQEEDAPSKGKNSRWRTKR